MDKTVANNLRGETRGFKR